MRIICKPKIILFIIFIIFFGLSLFSPNRVSGAGADSCRSCDTCSTSCGSTECTFQGCCDPCVKVGDDDGDGIKECTEYKGKCITICEAPDCPPSYQTNECKAGEEEVDKKTIDCGECNNTTVCYKCQDKGGRGPTDTPGPSPTSTPVPPTNTPAPPTSTPTETPTPTPARPGICLKETIDKNEVFPGGSFILTSEAKEEIASLFYAFYNKDNLYGPGNAKPFCVTKGTGESTTEIQGCPTGSVQLIYNGNKTSNKGGSRDLKYEDVFVQDTSTGAIPSSVSINAYFVTPDGRLSAPEAACVVSLSRGAPPATNTPGPGTGTPPPGGTGTPPPGGTGTPPPGGSGTPPPGGSGTPPPGGSGTPPPASPTPGAPVCGEPCNPNEAFDCPQDCPSCPVVNPVCKVAEPPPEGPACGKPCNPDKINVCPQECPFCPDTNPICVDRDDIPPTPTPGAPACGEPCNPEEAFDCPQECPSCPATNPKCVPAEPPPEGPACGEPCSPDEPNQCPDKCPFCPESNPQCDVDREPRISASPSPTPPAACNCDSVTYAGNFIGGGTMTITTFAVSLFPDTTEVRTMTYHVEKDGTEIAVSDPITAEKVPGSDTRYQTQWDFLVPVGEGVAGHYRIWVKIACGRITASVLGTETPKKTTLLDSLLNFLSRVFLLNNRNNLQPLAVATPTGIPDFDNSKPTVLAPTSKSLQLGTFHPVTNLKVGCKEISFDIY